MKWTDQTTQNLANLEGYLSNKKTPEMKRNTKKNMVGDKILANYFSKGTFTKDESNFSGEWSHNLMVMGIF